MKISICNSSIQQGHPQRQFDLYFHEIQKAAASGADIIVLPNNFPDTFASASRRIETSFLKEFHSAFTKLAAIAPDCLITGQTCQNIMDAPNCWIIRNNQITITDEYTDVYKQQRIRITTKPSRANDENTLQICLLNTPFDKSGSHIPDLHTNSLYISPLGIRDNGKTIDVYDGNIYAVNFPAGIHTLPPHLCTLTYINGEFSVCSPTSPHTMTSVLRFALQELCARWKIRQVIIGVSGGIDSALNLMLYRSVLPSSHLLAVNMPSRYNSDSTKQAALELAQALDIPYLTIPIQESVEFTCKQLNNIMATQNTGKHVSNFVFENIQARDRSSRILAALSAMYNGVFTCNANKAEITIGYGTMYGDISGFLCATGDLWKHEIYMMAKEINATYYHNKALPSAILTLPPSAELSADQNPETAQGDPLCYPYHDRLFRAWTESSDPLDLTKTIELYRHGILADVIETPVSINNLFATERDFISDTVRWWRMFRGLAVAKRLQSPPIISLCPYTFGACSEAQQENDDGIIYDLI